MAAVAELVAGLEAMRALRPPGVSGKRIAPLTSLCTQNIKDESDLIKTIYLEFKKTPATHKLGVLYVVDAVARQWIEKSAGQKPLANEEGTFAAGVKRMSELLPTLMDETVKEMPEDQKAKLAKLVDIWDRGNIFNADTIRDFKNKLNPSNNTTIPHSATEAPIATAPPTAFGSAPAPIKTNGPSAAEILAGLAQPQVQHTPQPPPQTIPPPFPFPQYAPAPPYVQPSSASQAPQSFPLPQYNGHAATPAAPMAAPFTAPAAAPAPDAMAALNAVKALLPPGATSDPDQFNKWIGVLQQLQQLRVDQSLWGDVIKTMVEGGASAINGTQPVHEPQSHSPRQGRGRGRSRSPNRRTRGSPVYDAYDKSSTNKYRQRSPLRRDSNSPSKQTDKILLGKPQKTVEFDHSLPPGHIKVYSRTLFVGGATCGEAELRRVFSRFGEVQTVISHRERRHAFIKMMTRRESENARQGADNSHDPEVSKAVRTVRWGVGFGPRDCSDYTTGISIIPIARLTEADRKWVNTAEVGGIGEMKLEPGMVFEEPDIEIGAGVSSKAISQRPNLNNQFSKNKNRDKGHRNSNNSHNHDNDNNNYREDSHDKQARRVPAYEQYGLPPVTPQANMPLPTPAPAAYTQPYQPPPFMPPPAPSPYDTAAYGVPPPVQGYGMGFSWAGAPGQ